MKNLSEARIGELSTNSAAAMKQTTTLPLRIALIRNNNTTTEEVITTLLECRNRDVDKANILKLSRLPG
jgi:hypothetical protein